MKTSKKYIMKTKIQNTNKFKEMVKKTPFLKSTYLNAANVRYISELVGQCERLGREYLNDKNIDRRDLDIVDEILQNKEIKNPNV